MTKQPRLTFILGAGASAECGAPVMANFLAVARRLAETGKLQGFEGDYANVAKVQHFLFLHQVKAKFDVENMENLFSAIEMGRTLGRLGNLNAEDILAARQSFLRLTAAVLETTMPLEGPNYAASRKCELIQNDKVRHLRANAPKGYHELGALCQKLLTNEDFRVDILTFNYDLGPEIAFSLYGIPYRYSGFPHDAQSKLPVTIHKLHGSMLWTRDGDTARDESATLQEYLHTKYVAESHPDGGYDLGPLSLVRKRLLDPEDPFEPYLVPPTDEKAIHRSTTTSIWAQAAEALSLSDAICIVGYSIPNTDVFFRCLWAISCSSEHDLRKIFVADVSPSVADKVHSMVGEPMRTRVMNLQCNLSAACRKVFEVYQVSDGTWL